MKLEGRTALITGGSQGLGRAVGEAFSVAGADVMLTARDDQALAEAAEAITARTGRLVVTHACDVSRADEVETLYRTATDTIGDVEILVNNAGASSRAPFVEITDEMWQADFDLKLFAAIRLCRLVLPKMRERGFGRVINVVSIVGKTPGPEGAPTNVSRAAGIALTKVLSKEFAQHAVTANALCIGRIKSQQWERFWKRDAPKRDYEAYLKDSGRDIPAGRLGEPEELAALALFLASDAGAYVNGTAINVDGGLAAVP